MLKGILNNANFKIPEIHTKEEELEHELHEAISTGKVEDCRDLIINQKVNVNFQSVHKFSHLGTAITLNKLEICELLIQNGADVNMKGDDTRLPLELAIKSLNIKIVELLIKNGANMHEKTSDGRTMKEYASDLLSKEDVKKIFV